MGRGAFVLRRERRGSAGTTRGTRRLKEERPRRQEMSATPKPAKTKPKGDKPINTGTPSVKGTLSESFVPPKPK